MVDISDPEMTSGLVLCATARRLAARTTNLSRCANQGRFCAMKRWITHIAITAYLSALAYGVVSYTISYSVSNHPSTYFVIWDMFCGWSAYETRVQLLAQGESGKFYRVDPAPWGEFQPYGEIGRRHYDLYGIHAPRLATNILKHTRHEPIQRVYIIEEAWAKKFNLPDDIWYRRFTEPKDVHKYYNVRTIVDGEGRLVTGGPSWLAYQCALSVSDNPRLQADSRKGKPFYAFDFAKRGNGVHAPVGTYDPSAYVPAASASLLEGN
jgi:hypothetical protein